MLKEESSRFLKSGSRNSRRYNQTNSLIYWHSTSLIEGLSVGATLSLTPSFLRAWERDTISGR